MTKQSQDTSAAMPVSDEQMEITQGDAYSGGRFCVQTRVASDNVEDLLAELEAGLQHVELGNVLSTGALFGLLGAGT